MEGLLGRIKYALMSRSRQKKLDFFVDTVCAGRTVKIVDVGVADIEYSPFDNFLEKHYPHPENITALSVYPLTHFATRYPSIRAVTYDGTRMPFEDKAFDVVHCNAVLEHVGPRERQIEFVRELARVGKRIFITTPSKMFPVETHTNVFVLHWLPKQVFDRYLISIGKKFACGDYMHLLSKSDLEQVLREAGLTNCRVITKKLLGFPLHYYVIGSNA